MTRNEAKSKGLKTYNTGKPCRAGHHSDRYTSTGHCMECQRLRAVKDLIVITHSVHRDDADIVREVVTELNNARGIES